MTVFFVGAGPGDHELLTVKARKVIESADVVIYAGSLVPQEILEWVNKGVELHDSSKLNLEEITGIIIDAVKKGKTVARIHSGDPSIYGALREQVEILERHGIEYKVIPGISSFLAAAASFGAEYTIPEITQTLIITRLSGRTKVPEREKLEKLAKHRASMCIFLSVHMIDEVVKQLSRGYGEDAPVVVVSRVSRGDEKIISGTLCDIAGKVEKEGIDRTALILVGDFLKSRGKKSKLYEKEFSHSFRW